MTGRTESGYFKSMTTLHATRKLAKFNEQLYRKTNCFIMIGLLGQVTAHFGSWLLKCALNGRQRSPQSCSMRALTKRGFSQCSSVFRINNYIITKERKTDWSGNTVIVVIFIDLCNTLLSYLLNAQPLEGGEVLKCQQCQVPTHTQTSHFSVRLDTHVGLQSTGYHCCLISWCFQETFLPFL